MPYAAPSDVFALIGERQAQLLWTAGTVSAGDALAAAVTKAILLADGEINTTLKRSGFSVPVTPSTDPPSDIGTQMMAMLAHHSAVLAITQYGAAGAVDVLPRMKELHQETAAWLTAMLLGTENLLDADRQAAEAEKLFSGRLALASSGERGPERRVFRRAANLYGPGFAWGDMRDLRGPV